METSDPDDFMTLLWLADHPLVDLLAVLVMPGSYDQCQLVRWALDRCDKPDVLIGALHGTEWWATKDGQKPRVSGFHYKVYSDNIKMYNPGNDAVLGPKLVCHMLNRHDDVTYVVGSAPKNLGEAFRIEPELRLHRWVQQGGFAGDNLVAEEDRLGKFNGKLTCPSFNPGGAPKQTLELLANPNIQHKLFVSKNVCHGVVWDAETQRVFSRMVARNLGIEPPTAETWTDAVRPGLRTMLYGLACYLRDKGKAKAIHDLVAAAVALDESVCRFSDEVEIYWKKGEWGARLQQDTRTQISIGYNEEQFIKVLAGG